MIGADFGLSRDFLWEALTKEGISTRKYFYPPIHRQKALEFMNCSDEGLPFTIKVSEGVLCLPVYSSMSEDTVRKVTGTIKTIYKFREELLNKEF